jgi:hypothetical protein
MGGIAGGGNPYLYFKRFAELFWWFGLVVCWVLQMNLLVFLRDPPLWQRHFRRINHYTPWETSTLSNKR